ncbi:MAG: hypothetical protein GXO69_04365 [Acidobacteria bacterium]|nr:hypothetical protein [Acidobacteriota bacterium]
MNGDGLEQYYRILEVDAGATLQEIEHAYRMLKRIYSGDSTAAVPGMREFSETKRLELLDEIENAYRMLLKKLKTQTQGVVPRQRRVEEGTPVNGELLFRTRNEIGVTLDEVSRRTKVRKDYIRALEMEDFGRLPDAAVYVRGFVRAVAEYLGFSADDIVPSYMLRYNNWTVQRKKK